jgi:hypothetical protein
MTNDVLVGEEGWLFLSGGSNSVMDVYSGKRNELSWCADWAALLNTRKKSMSEKGIEYFHVAAPEKLGVYSRYADLTEVPEFDIGNSPANQLSELISSEVGGFYINPFKYLHQQSMSMDVYHKTDTHWNFLGAYSTYQLLMSHLGLECNTDILSIERKVGPCLMDLGSKVEGAVKENVFFFSSSENVKRSFANALVEYKEKNAAENQAGLHIGSSVVFNNNNALHNKKVLIFGDSFSEYRPQLLTGILAETFSEVIFVWSLNIDSSVVDDFSPDIVVTEAAERFMPFTVPDDRFKLDEYVAKTLQEIDVRYNDEGLLK